MASHGPNKNTIKVLEQSHVSPPPGSVPPTQLPLTFFDTFFFGCCPIQRLFFYRLPHPTQHLIPNLKHSLSLTLRHFFPLAATLHLPPPPLKPYLLYSRESSIQFTVAESSADFNALISNQVKDVRELHPFVPKLSHDASSLSNDEAPTYVLPVLALQVTIFPNSGLCIGYTINHVAADGRSIIHFMKSWASICKNIGTQELTSFDASLEKPPSHGRDVIKEPSEPDSVYLLEPKYSWAWNSMKEKSSINFTPLRPLEGIVSATFLMRRAHIERLKARVSAYFTSNEEIQTLHASSFVVTCSFTWVHLVKSHALAVKTEQDGDNTCYLPLFVDCRDWKGFEFPVPATYFGNCLAVCIVEMKRSELVGENGIFTAAKAIASRIKDLENGALRATKKQFSDAVEAMELGNVMQIASSPNLRAYDVDFGWGNPNKTEIVHIDISKAISLTESGEEEGGIEIGVALSKDKMGTFSASFVQGLKLL